jgi:hypothetical protein
MPNISTVFRWLERHAEFSERYVRARDMQADALADEILDIADDSRNDWVERMNKDGTPSGQYVADSEVINRARLRVDSRKWIASKLKPKKYGERLEIESTQKHSADQYSDDELAAIAGRSGGRTAKAKGSK